MRAALIAIAGGKLFQAPGNVPAGGVTAYEPYVLQPAGPGYVADGAYVQYVPASPYVAAPALVPRSMSPLNAATVLLLGAAIGAAAATYSAPVATLAVDDLEAGKA